MIHTINYMCSKIASWRWIASPFETCIGWYQNKIQTRASRWFYYTTYNLLNATFLLIFFPQLDGCQCYVSSWRFRVTLLLVHSLSFLWFVPTSSALTRRFMASDKFNFFLFCPSSNFNSERTFAILAICSHLFSLFHNYSPPRPHRFLRQPLSKNKLFPRY